MTPKEMKELAELLQKVPGIKSIELEDVQGLAQLLRETPEIGSIEVKGWFGTGLVITRTSAGPTFMPAPQIYQAPAAAASSTFNFKHTIAQMVQRNASDLLLKVGRPPTIRLNGELHTLEMPPVKPEDLKMLAEQVMTPRQVKEFAEKKEADFAIGVPGVGRFRTNIYQQRGTLAFAFRPIAYEVKTIGQLHLTPVMEEIALKPRVLILVTGITG